MEKGMLRHADVREFMFAGNAVLTIVHRGERFTYRVRETDDKEAFFVSVLNGQDNESNYSYMGIIRKKTRTFERTRGSKVGADAPSWRMFRDLFEGVRWKNVPPLMEVWHEGKCGRCGRTLTVPESIANGIGPECMKVIARSRKS